jgi:hypothetical protein
MNKQLENLARQRLELFETIEAQRIELTEISRQWEKPLAVVDTGLTAMRFLRGHPGLVSGGFAALLTLRGMGIAGIVQKGWRLLYLYPSILAFGLKFISPSARSPSVGHDSSVDHSEKRS